MDFKKIVLALFGLCGFATAYSNSTMTEGYRLITYGDIFGGVIAEYVAVLGDWFYVIMIMAPYVGVYLAQKDLHLPTIWLTCCLVAYNVDLVAMPPYIYYFIAVVWVGGIFLKLVSPKFGW